MEVGTQFGQLQFDGNSPRISSKVLGIDISGLVDNLVEARRIPIIDKEVQATENTVKLAAVAELKSIMQSFQGAVSNLRNPTLGMGGSDVFRTKAAFAQSSSGTPPSQLVRITATNAAPISEFSLKVNRLATTDVINSSGSFTAPTDLPLAADGQLSLNGTNIALTADMNLTQIRDTINASTADSGVSAAIVKVNETTYRLSLQGNETGQAIDLTGSDGDVLTSLTLAASGATDTSLSAELDYNGVIVTRATNSITDLVDGITFDLFSADPATTLSVEIEQDAEQIKDAIISFVDTYNALADFIKSQQTISDDGSVSDEAILFGDPLLRSVSSQLGSFMSAAVGGASGINNLRQAGITFDNTNKLVINDTILDEAILSKGTEVAELFAFQTSRDNELTQVLGRPANIGELAGQPFTVRVMETDATGRPLSAEIDYNGTTYATTLNGSIITGAADSPFAGFSFGYNGDVINAGDPAATTTITATQGIADRIGFFLSDMLRTNTGVLDIKKTELEDKNTKIELDIERLNEQVSLYRDRISAQFLAVERNIAILNSIQESLSAQFEAMNSSN